MISAAEQVAVRQFDAVRLPLVQSWLARRGGPSSAMAALFSYGADLGATEVRSVLGDRLVDELVAASVIEDAPGGLRARYRISPVRGLLFLSDPPESGPETVMGPGATTFFLMELVRQDPGDVLDMGCGAGSLALVAASRGARSAVGVDTSRRAIQVARFNARLNDLAAEFLLGDLLEPVRNRRFDLIVSQPPYVVLPPGMASTTFLHGGPLGEELAIRFAAAFPEALAEGGRALLHFDAPLLRGPQIGDRLRSAMRDAGTDLVVLTGPGPSADLEAAAYGVLEDPGLGPGYAGAVRRYREHLASLGVEGFARVLAVLRKAGQPKAFTVQVPSGTRRLGPGDLDLLLRGLDLAQATDEVLLAARVGVAPGARIQEDADPAGASAARLTLRFGRGVPADQEITDAVRILMGLLDASPSVSAALEAYARECRAAVQEVREGVLAAVRDGLTRGAYVVGARG